MNANVRGPKTTDSPSQVGSRRDTTRWGLIREGLLRFWPLYKLANFIFSARFVVQGDSMEPSFTRDQYILVSRLAYFSHEPRRGDVVVLRHPSVGGRNYIKRIVALPGERVRTEGARVYIHDLHLDEPYLPYLEEGTGMPAHHRSGPKLPSEASAGVAVEGWLDTPGEWVLAGDQYFVVGDNRVASDDSRSFGPISQSSIIGKAWVRYWPRTAWGFLS